MSLRHVVNYTDKMRLKGGQKTSLGQSNLYHIVHYFGHSFGQNSLVVQMTARGI